MSTVYRSKIDAWLLIVLVAAMVMSLYASVTVLSAGSAAWWMLLLLTAAAGIGLPLWLLLSTRYVLEPGQLTIRSGPFKWQVPVSDITSMAPTRSPLSSPALSLDRLRIDYGSGKSIMISPRDKEAFMKQVEELRCQAAQFGRP